ncbi:MAG: GGDEF domain-containing protein [Hoeflea sp.]|uniref:GGDEF domain-containing protein n=1 Tax=Hoeflea sp. TaxID=1940281 RepID=UPI0032EFD365
MIAVARNWIVKQLELGEFQSYGDVCRKSVPVGLKVSLLAYGINLACHLLMHQFGLLPYDLKAALVVATLLTPPITFVLAVFFYVIFGCAIHDIGVSRARLEELSQTDTLTGIANRRAFQTAFEAAEGDRIMAMFDIDRFKVINDTHGHSSGDQAIIRVATVLKSVFAENCVCARIGGEEFGVLCPDMPFGEFAACCELARRRIAGERIAAESETFSVTVSGGVADSLPGEGFSQVFSRADKALYEAKAGGRDRIVLSRAGFSPRSEWSNSQTSTPQSAA